ncbi:MAG: hypothetical protein ABL860_01425 [Candidatus Nitrotoga sp.]
MEVLFNRFYEQLVQQGCVARVGHLSSGDWAGEMIDATLKIPSKYWPH